jgi:hypothetical protein
MYALKKITKPWIYTKLNNVNIFREREREIFLDGSVLVGRLIMLIKEGKDCYKTKESRLI